MVMSFMFTLVVFLKRKSNNLFDKIEDIKKRADSTKDKEVLLSLESELRKLRENGFNQNHWSAFREVSAIIEAKLSMIN